jgi:hypothetical protein
MPTPGTKQMFDKAFDEAIQELKERGFDGRELVDALEEQWMDGDWPSQALGERLNALDEQLGGVFEDRIEAMREAFGNGEEEGGDAPVASEAEQASTMPQIVARMMGRPEPRGPIKHFCNVVTIRGGVVEDNALFSGSDTAEAAGKAERQFLSACRMHLPGFESYEQERIDELIENGCAEFDGGAICISWPSNR